MDFNNIYKAVETHRTVTYVALVPDVKDFNGDIITKDEIIKTAHDFVKNLAKKKVNVDHKKDTDVEGAVFVESYILPSDVKTPNDKTIPSGSWLVAIQFSEDLRKDVVAGKYVGISIEGKGRSKEI